MLARRTAIRCAAAGAVTGLPLGLAALGTLGADLAYLVYQQFRLILGIATIYGHEPTAARALRRGAVVPRLRVGSRRRQAGHRRDARVGHDGRRHDRREDRRARVPRAADARSSRSSASSPAARSTTSLSTPWRAAPSATTNRASSQIAGRRDLGRRRSRARVGHSFTAARLHSRTAAVKLYSCAAV